jgi:transcriptional regulator with XRE-family HTH domain
MNKTADTPIARALRALMVAHKYRSATSLSNASGISQPTISRILNGTTGDPEGATVKALAQFFSVTESQMRGTDPLSNVLTAEEPGAQYKERVIEPSLNDALSLLDAFRKLPPESRDNLARHAATLAEAGIPDTPTYSAETISRALQAVFFPNVNASDASRRNAEERITQVLKLIQAIHENRKTV